MYYSQSNEIRELILRAEKIFINCHINPDIDSIGSALAMHNYIKTLGKQSKVYSPNKLVDSLSFLTGYGDIIIRDIDNDLLSEYNLLIFLDTADEKRVGCILDDSNRKNTLVIDHHKGNTKYGKYNLVDATAGSTGEILYRLLGDLGASMDAHIGSALLAGMAGDSSGFRNQGANSQVFKYVSELMDIGVDKTKILTEIYGNIPVEGMRFLGEFLKNFKMSENYPYCWNIITREMVSKYGDDSAIGLYSGLFLRALKDTEFGMLFIEKDDNEIAFHVKARVDIDVSTIAINLGGGGHRRAGGNTFKGHNLDGVVKMALIEADNFYRKT